MPNAPSASNSDAAKPSERREAEGKSNVHPSMVASGDSYSKTVVAKKEISRSVSPSHASKARAYVCALPVTVTLPMPCDASPAGSRTSRWPSASLTHSPGASKAATQPSMKYALLVVSDAYLSHSELPGLVV